MLGGAVPRYDIHEIGCPFPVGGLVIAVAGDGEVAYRMARGRSPQDRVGTEKTSENYVVDHGCRFVDLAPQRFSKIVRRADGAVQEKLSKISPPIQLSVRSFVYKDAKIIGAENHHTAWETIFTIITDDCFVQLYIIRTSLSIGTGM